MNKLYEWHNRSTDYYLSDIKGKVLGSVSQFYSGNGIYIAKYGHIVLGQYISSDHAKSAVEEVYKNNLSLGE
jgi:hypothetical protein